MSPDLKGRSYAGIGSRKTPDIVLESMKHAARYLWEKGLILRSGGANGADTAFEDGLPLRAGNAKEIYLPWEGFNGNKSALFQPTQRAYEYARRFHPAYKQLSKGAQKLMARNTHQVLGKDLDDPSLFILCWTPDGKGEGGTGQAIRIADAHDIPVFDMGGMPLDEIDRNITAILRERNLA